MKRPGPLYKPTGGVCGTEIRTNTRLAESTGPASGTADQPAKREVVAEVVADLRITHRALFDHLSLYRGL